MNEHGRLSRVGFRRKPFGCWRRPFIPRKCSGAQLHFKEFDISEMSLSSLTIATAAGIKDWVAIPVYSARMFFHTRILVHNDSGIETPQDLKGKRVGVPEYQQTSAIWSRGILEHEFGVAPKDMEFFMERPPEMSHGGATRVQSAAGGDRASNSAVGRTSAKCS